MTRPVVAQLLVVAATDRELTGAGRARTLACGIGPVESAVRTAAALAQARPGRLLHVGIAGARRGGEVGLLDIVVGSEAVYCDSELATPLAADPELLRTVSGALPGVRVLPIGTSGRVGGARATPIEAMEGYAVLRAAGLAGVPAVEVRVVSNEIEEADRSRWLFDEAFARLEQATGVLVDALGA
ncbi:MAG: hypothetical protein U0R69_00720 [Gaiellales bacterium]